MKSMSFEAFLGFCFDILGISGFLGQMSILDNFLAGLLGPY
jgi:hypothetical protein